MNSALKNRIAKCDSRLKDGNNKLCVTCDAIKKDIQDFANFRISHLHETVGRFKKLVETLNMKIKDNKYEIPEYIQTPEAFTIEFNKVEYSPEQMERLGDGASSFIQNASNLILAQYAKRKGKSFTPTSTSGGLGNPWIDLAVGIANMFGAIAEKKAQEITEVERYEASTETQLKKIDAHIDFCGQIKRRLSELIEVSTELKKRCSSQLDKLESILAEFNASSIDHVHIYKETAILVKGCSELAKIEILDSNNKLSQADGEYIIKTRQLSNRYL